MKSKMILILCAGLTSGCAKTIEGSYCDIYDPVYFNSQNTIEWLADNDPIFLRDTITRNEVWLKLCSG